MIELKNFIGGKWLENPGSTISEVTNPATGELIAKVRAGGVAEVAEAVSAASEASAVWRLTPMQKRCRILMRCKEIFERRLDELTASVVRENGKTFPEAAGEVRRGIEVLEFACGMPSIAKGDYVENVAANIDGYIYREPLGVVAGACPFNFPAMIPLWMVPVALACGNSFVLKPSEKCPLTSNLIADIFAEGGLPGGVLNLIHGDKETFRNLIEEPEVMAVSFVGSTSAARQVWLSATENGKRCQALGGAKNYVVVMPDSDRETAIRSVVSSSFGCAGERCMASSVLVLVGEAEDMLSDVVEAAKALRLGDGMASDTQMGPLVSAAHLEHVCRYVKAGLDAGALLLLDGRSPKVPDECRGGFFLGPTVFDRVTPEMSIVGEEIFGPVLSVMRAANLDEALELANLAGYGNGASIHTTSGASAREFRTRIQCGMVGVNSGVPAPLAFFSFGGRKDSFLGDLRMHGPDGVEFFTRKKSVIERWDGNYKTGNIWADR